MFEIDMAFTFNDIDLQMTFAFDPPLVEYKHFFQLCELWAFVHIILTLIQLFKLVLDIIKVYVCTEHEVASSKVIALTDRQTCRHTDTRKDRIYYLPIFSDGNKPYWIYWTWATFRSILELIQTERKPTLLSKFIQVEHTLTLLRHTLIARAFSLMRLGIHLFYFRFEYIMESAKCRGQLFMKQ